MPTPAIGAPQALEAFTRDLGGTLDALPTIVSPAVGRAQETLLSASGVSLEDVPAELQYVPTADDLDDDVLPLSRWQQIKGFDAYADDETRCCSAVLEPLCRADFGNSWRLAG